MIFKMPNKFFCQMNIEVVAEKESQISFDELTKCCRNKSRLEELTFGSALKTNFSQPI